MSRRPKRKPYVAYWMDWSEVFEEHFGALWTVLCADASPPQRVRVHPGKAHVTLVAICVDAKGRRIRLTSRIARQVSQ